MLGEHPSSLTELHVQKHQVNSQIQIQHSFAFSAALIFCARCVFV